MSSVDVDLSHRDHFALWEAAWLLQVTTNAARNLVYERRLEALPGTGRYIMIPYSELERTLRSPLAVIRLRDLAHGRIAAPKPLKPSTAPAPLTRFAKAHDERSTDSKGDEQVEPNSSSMWKTCTEPESERSFVAPSHEEKSKAASGPTVVEKPMVDDTHTPTRRPGRRPPIEPVTDLTDLSDQRLGIPDPELAQLVWCALSRQLGTTGGWRGWAYDINATLAGIGQLEVRHKGTKSVRPRVEPAPFPEVPALPWPGPENALRRLGLEPSDVDTLWEEADQLEEEFATLPLPLVLALYPPAIWPVVAAAIEWGPYELNRRLERWLRLAARGDAPGGRHLAPASLRKVMNSVRHFMRVLKTLEETGYPSELLERWQRMPDPIAIDRKWSSGRERPTRERVAPTLEPLRLVRADLELKISQLERTERGRLALREPLRDQSLLDLFVLTAGRVEPISLMLVGDFRWDYPCEDGVDRPAVLMKELKGQRWVKRWKPIPEEAARRLKRYIDYLGIADQAEHTLWPGQWVHYERATGVQVSGRAGRRLPPGVSRMPDPTPQRKNQLSRHVMRLLRPHLSGRMSAHLIRRFGQKTAKNVARDYLDAHPQTDEYITPEVMAKCLLDHAFGSLAARYEELTHESFRERWSRIVAAGVWDYYAGDRGAKRGLDRERIVYAKRGFQEAQADFRAAEESLRGLERLQIEHEESRNPLQCELAKLVTTSDRELAELRTKRQAITSAVLSADGELSEAEWRRYEVSRARIDDEIDGLRGIALSEERRLTREIEADQKRLSRLQREGATELRRLNDVAVERRAELEAACAARVPVSDHERPGDLQAELELLLTGVQTGERSGSEQVEEPQLLRERLTAREYAAAMGIALGTLNRHIREALASETGFAFPVGDRRNAWFQPLNEIFEEISPRRRYFLFSLLDLSKYHPTQSARMKATLQTGPHGERAVGEDTRLAA